MKTPVHVLDAIRRRVAANWHLDIAIETTTWPYDLPLGHVAKQVLEADFGSFQRLSVEWRDWAASHQLSLATATRKVQGTNQSLPTHVRITDLDTAAAVLGKEWQERVQRGRGRLAVLRLRFPSVDSLPSVVKAVDGYSDTEFELLCTASTWFRNNSAAGLTPRQVPVEGLHAKWLNTHAPLVRALAQLDTLNLLPRHEQRVHFTYLDQDHLAGGGRRHDSATVGDRVQPAYQPHTVIISENKDTAIHFPALAGAVSVEGGGFAAAEAIASIDWLKGAPRLLYWGDLDPHGYEIVNWYRKAGLPIETVLMDLATFERFERFGTMLDARGNVLGCPARKPMPHLTASEREVYDLLTDPQWSRVRRLEQERIPLTIAHQATTKYADRPSVVP